MLGALRELQDNVTKLGASIRELSSVRVDKKGVLEFARSIVDLYFTDVRERVIAGGVSADLVAEVDNKMQELLEMTHHHTSTRAYQTLIKGILGFLIDLEKSALIGLSRNGSQRYDAVDKLIIETLESLIPSAACSYGQAVQDLRSSERLSWRGPATDLRESLRETLDFLAPDKDVESQQGFKLEKDAAGPTMKQKVRYVLHRRGISKTSGEPAELAVEAVNGVLGTFVRSVYTRSSVSTHTPTERNEVIRVRDWVRTAFCELLEIRI